MASNDVSICAECKRQIAGVKVWEYEHGAMCEPCAEQAIGDDRNAYYMRPMDRRPRKSAA